MGPSPTGRGPADRAGLVVLDRVDPVDLAVLGRAGLGRAGLADPVDLGDQGMDPAGLDRVDPVDPAALDRAGLADPVDLGDQGMDPAGLVDPAGLDPVDPVDLAVLDRVGLVDLGRAGLGRGGLVVTGRAVLAVQDLDRGQADPVDPAALDRAGLADPVDPAVLGRAGPVVLGRVDIRGLAVLDRAGPVDPVDPAVLGRAGPVDLGDQGMDPAGRVDPAGLDPAGRENLGDQGMDPADRVDPVDRRRTRPGVRTSGVALRWAAPGMRRMASAHPTTVRRLHRDNMDSAGMTGLLPERRRRSGTGRRPRVAGAVRRLPVVGTAHGMVRRVTGATRSVISGRSITTATTRSRSLTRSLGDGASGSSESGSRCTDTT
jgi:hypothetical protein